MLHVLHSRLGLDSSMQADEARRLGVRSDGVVRKEVYEIRCGFCAQTSPGP